MVQSPTKPITFEDYLTYDDGTDNRYQLFDGALVLMTPPAGEHGAIAGVLLIQFHLEIHRLGLDWWVRQGQTGVRTTESRSRLPDVCVITNEQAQTIRYQAAILTTAPLLAIEIVSPESVTRDYRFKRSEYAALGMAEYWIVDPLEARISVLLLNDGFYDVTAFKDSDRLLSRTFPELALTVEQVLTAQ
ncbi:MAG: Uma2 family endonuclease [Stenomitos frigidus ULC029]